MQQPHSEAQRETASPSGTGAAVPTLVEEAYLRFAPMLRKIATRKFGIPPHDAEPLVHDVFATFFMHASQVNEVEPYLVAGICNASRQHLRRQDATREVPFCPDRPCAAAQNPDILRAIEKKVLLGRTLARVGCRCRELFDRYYVNGETTRSIAEALGTTPATVLVFLHHCRKRARAAYRSLTENS